MSKPKKVWVDLDNSPHVPFFKPIIEELEKRGTLITITIRDCSQTQQLADLLKVPYKKIGKHYGKNKIIKILGTLFRATQLLPHVIKERPDIAVSHGSRALMVAARMLNIPTLGIFDYEHTKGFFYPTWVMAPEVIPLKTLPISSERTFAYPGIKEDAYVPRFKPNKSILAELDIPKDNLLTVIRPPAVAAHYHNHEADLLFDTAVDFLATKGNVSMIILPRYTSQSLEIKQKYPNLIVSRQIIIPEKAFDGLNLMWFSDFVISGGGTMNREAAALGVPVYSIFRGKIGAVDHFLSDANRLVLLEKPDDFKNKVKVEKRIIPENPESADNKTLNSIVETISMLLDKN